ncbi:hypothetical protein [Achromobacter denitrificans]|uniref:hypothetical protein n=1 Tax=Achromobacter denitrificans TaxID=32002 RepID=UPI0029BE9EEC|nr:hypothetical protein [Achromobacter sp.]
MDSRNSDVADRLARNWQTALQRVFPAGIPESASWSTREAIVGVLSAIAAPSTGHMFYPDHGGDDLVAAKQSARSEDWVELFSDTSESWPRIVRPQRLSFICPENCVDMAHFLLASGDISVKPEFPDSCGASSRSTQKPLPEKNTLTANGITTTTVMGAACPPERSGF